MTASDSFIKKLQATVKGNADRGALRDVQALKIIEGREKSNTEYTAWQKAHASIRK